MLGGVQLKDEVQCRSVLTDRVLNIQRELRGSYDGRDMTSGSSKEEGDDDDEQKDNESDGDDDDDEDEN